ncbi:MAG: 50S ribosomal protein L25 [Bacteroidota bacterium]|jgi:large subunit ribosomal protein L25
MNAIQLNGTARTEKGKKAAASLRSAGMVPCNLYGSKENKSFSLSNAEVRHLIYTPDFQIADINLDGSTHRAIVKEIQMDPVTDEVTHLDFLAIENGKSITVQLPVRIIGGSPKGVRDGGKLQQKVRKLKVKTIPERLVPALELNLEHLELGKTFRVSDINIEGIEVMLAASIPVASVFVPRVVKEEPKAAAASAAAPAAAAKK